MHSLILLLIVVPKYPQEAGDRRHQRRYDPYGLHMESIGSTTPHELHMDSMGEGKVHDRAGGTRNGHIFNTFRIGKVVQI
jgi:hypothetical protein